jgi:hypothetical protein
MKTHKTSPRIYSVIFVFGSALLLSVTLACPSIADPHKDESGKGRKEWNRSDDKHDKHDKRGEDYREWWEDIENRMYGGRFDVPAGHQPPPGMCRLWYPGRPPGQQPPPQDCASLPRERHAYVIYGNYGYDPKYDWGAHRKEDALRDLPHTLLDVLLDQLDRRQPQ